MGSWNGALCELVTGQALYSASVGRVRGWWDMDVSHRCHNDAMNALTDAGLSGVKGEILLAQSAPSGPWGSNVFFSQIKDLHQHGPGSAPAYFQPNVVFCCGSALERYSFGSGLRFMYRGSAVRLGLPCVQEAADEYFKNFDHRDDLFQFFYPKICLQFWGGEMPVEFGTMVGTMEHQE